MQTTAAPLSRRLYIALRRCLLKRKQARLNKRRTELTRKAAQAANDAQALARLHRFDPALNDYRRALRLDLQNVGERHALVSRKLLQLGVAS